MLRDGDPSIGALLDQPPLRTKLRYRVIDWASSYPWHRRWLVRRLLAFMLWAFVQRTRVLFGFDEVREALSSDADLPVSWGWKMELVTGGPAAGGRNFVLGMARGAEYNASYAQLAAAFPLCDATDRVSGLAASEASGIVDRIGQCLEPSLDAVEQLVTAVPAALCRSYYGLEIPDPRAFARWTLVVSSYLFGPPFDRRDIAWKLDPAVDAAAALLRGVIRGSIRKGRGAKAPAGTVLDRMLAAIPPQDDDVIHAQLFGMVLGFIPTNVLAGGNILQTLLLQPAFLERARLAALGDDDEQLWRCLREALRFRNINPGPFRVVGPKGYTLRRRWWWDVRLGPGTPVLASTQAAMFDARRVKHPTVFDPSRPGEDYLMFGVGQHWCLGAHIAKAQITQTFKPLLKRHGLRAQAGRNGRMQRFSIYPLHMHIRFDP